MRRTTLCGVGAILVGIAGGCSGEDTGPGSGVAQNKAGSGGSGGNAGSISLDLPAGYGGGGAGGMGGTGGASAGSGGSGKGGTSAAGSASQAGTSSGTGGAKPAGMCKRVTGSDADCLDFYPAEPPDPARPQAYTCDDSGAYVALNGTKGGKCASVSFVPGSRYGACCPP